ncbi:unnamed protein product [Trichogramma brassicae]|uniref:Uncharacterized protein n=1 Tax=Trichogramma brassicae TaxID=86971 RepID=A0A6H5HTG4_9HYME|nr:unnamed protein product [Trichogramma brassicae]
MVIYTTYIARTLCSYPSQHARQHRDQLFSRPLFLNSYDKDTSANIITGEVEPDARHRGISERYKTLKYKIPEKFKFELNLLRPPTRAGFRTRIHQSLCAAASYTGRISGAELRRSKRPIDPAVLRVPRLQKTLQNTGVHAEGMTSLRSA